MKFRGKGLFTKICMEYFEVADFAIFETIDIHHLSVAGECFCRCRK